MKKVTVFVGSLRQGSFNRATYLAYHEIAGTRFEFDEIAFGDWPLYNQDITEEPAAVANAAARLKHSDGILFFSPEYNYSVPGALKNAIDWLSRNNDKPFDEKRAAIIGASPSALGTGRMQYHLRQIGVFLNLHFLNKPEVMINQAMNKYDSGRLIDEETRKFLGIHAEAFEAFLGA